MTNVDGMWTELNKSGPQTLNRTKVDQIGLKLTEWTELDQIGSK